MIKALRSLIVVVVVCCFFVTRPIHGFCSQHNSGPEAYSQNRTKSRLTVSGQVVSTQDGSPVVDAEVTVEIGSAPPIQVFAKTGVGGDFSIELPVTDSYSVFVWKEGFLPYHREGVVFEGPLARIKVPLDPGSLVQGRVIGPDSTGISGARVELLDEVDAQPSRVCQTIDGGLFRLGMLKSGLYHLNVVHPSFVTRSRIILEIPSAQPIVIRMEPAAQETCCRVWGLVSDQNGLAVQDTEIYLQEQGKRLANMWSAKTDANGMYSLSGVKPGVYTQRFFSRHYSSSNLHVNDLVVSDKGSARADFQFKGDQSVPGTVVNQHDNPIYRDIVLTSQDGQRTSGGFPVTYQERSDRDGIFEFKNIPAGHYTIQPGLSNLDAEAAIPVTVPSSKPIALVRNTGVNLVGTLTNESGRPVPKFDLRMAVIPSGGMLATRIETLEGRFIVKALEEETFAVEITLPDGDRYIGTVDLRRSNCIAFALDSGADHQLKITYLQSTK